MDPDRFFQVIGDGVRKGTVLKCSRRGIVWTWGSSSLLAGFVRSESGWGWNFFNTIFVSSHMYPENPEGTQVIVGSMNMGYISDTARNRTHNLFRPKREPIPLGHSDGPENCLCRDSECF